MNTSAKKTSGLLAICSSCVGFLLMFTPGFTHGIASARNCVFGFLFCGFVLSLLARPTRRARLALALTITFFIANIFWPSLG